MPHILFSGIAGESGQGKGNHRRYHGALTGIAGKELRPQQGSGAAKSGNHRQHQIFRSRRNGDKGNES
jgi:hypothetical protein